MDELSARDKNILDVSIKVMRSLSTLRDPYYNGHEKRVSFMAIRLASELKMDAGFIERLKYAAWMHDIGKIAMAESILNKLRLSHSEVSMIHSHSEMGGVIAKSLDLEDGEIETMVLQHHENWNGTGYPHRLKGDQICIGARILRVCDCFDAMTNIRPYRPIFTTKDTLHEMDKEIGTSFDPDIYKVFRAEMEAI